VYGLALARARAVLADVDRALATPRAP
jgi:hypothetical protein